MSISNQSAYTDEAKGMFGVTHSQWGCKIPITIMPHVGDLAAERRLITIIELAITIGKREGLIGNHFPKSENIGNQSNK